ncbi:MAG: hypothetical protein Q9218_007668, partial [Villophora microphyllina]
MSDIADSTNGGMKDRWDRSKEYHDKFFTRKPKKEDDSVYTEPVFSVEVARNIQDDTGPNMFPQYGLLAREEYISAPSDLPDSVNGEKIEEVSTDQRDGRIFLNTNVGFSAFICGSQGSGKSYTLSCILEAGLIRSGSGNLPQPQAGLVFHWDKHSANQPCETAYLCSSGTPVTVLVSPSNFDAMKELYENLPNLRPGAPKPVVKALFLRQADLDVTRMMSLMSVDTEKGRPALYMNIVRKVLRDIALESRGKPTNIYTTFKSRMDIQKLQPDQRTLLNMRLQLLEGFFDRLVERDFENVWLKQELDKRQANSWSSPPGSLTIVDLTDSFVDQGSACALFDICLSLFLANQDSGHTIVALDEAHKFMSEGEASMAFTESLLSVIRLYRHYGARVVIATQEPTISPRLLDLCSMTIVHRFTSPDWMLALKAHLAGASALADEGSQQELRKIFRTIVNLD